MCVCECVYVTIDNTLPLMDVKLRRALIGVLVKALATSGFHSSISLIVDRVPS